LFSTQDIDTYLFIPESFIVIFNVY